MEDYCGLHELRNAGGRIVDELIVRLARTLACDERLRILAALIDAGEKPPSVLADELKLLPSALSAHLTKLATAGLIQRRHSGGWSYCVAKSPYNESTLSGRTLAWLRDLLNHPQAVLERCGLREVRNISAAQAQAHLHRVLFDAATAFTDLRRLQILRWVAVHGEASLETLCGELKMSVWAAGRQTDKLVRRGYLCRSGRDGETVFRLAPRFKTPLHAALWKIVQASWAANRLRTS
jgi:DNA-binding MarR family transcriptional regulator